MPEIVDRNDRVPFFMVRHFDFQSFFLGFEFTQLAGDALSVGTADDVIDNAIDLTGHFYQTFRFQPQF
ncbi:hypothetical protein [Litoreibacter roseus]|uniref:hypothetical protein n=1 Tax=Litoreibacter roseus TaxID=2601869 RepID=UPI001FA9ABEC|nr:hypothetical protein [Litoreibacter roseus]